MKMTLLHLRKVDIIDINHHAEEEVDGEYYKLLYKIIVQEAIVWTIMIILICMLTEIN